MKLGKISGYLDYLFIFIFYILLVFGSTKSYQTYTLPLSITSILALVGIWSIQGRKIKLPANFILFSIFLVMLAIHTYLFKGDAFYNILFLSGGLFWLAAFNLRQILSKSFFTSLIFLGILMAGVYLDLIVRGTTSFPSVNLAIPLSGGVLHNHLGDLWAVILVGVIYKAFQKFQKWQIPLIILALALIAQSLSRSAIASLVAGSFYIYYKSGNDKAKEKALKTILVIAGLLFIFMGAFRTTLFSRVYFLQGIRSFIDFPLGIGVGNFVELSNQTSLAHNLVLEFLTGMGVFSGIFILWLMGIFKSFANDNTNTLYKALFLAIFVNFFFDITYVIPTMIWLWFITLALAFT